MFDTNQTRTKATFRWVSRQATNSLKWHRRLIRDAAENWAYRILKKKEAREIDERRVRVIANLLAMWRDPNKWPEDDLGIYFSRPTTTDYQVAQALYHRMKHTGRKVEIGDNWVGIAETDKHTPPRNHYHGSAGPRGPSSASPKPRQFD